MNSIHILGIVILVSNVFASVDTELLAVSDPSDLLSPELQNSNELKQAAAEVFDFTPLLNNITAMKNSASASSDAWAKKVTENLDLYQFVKSSARQYSDKFHELRLLGLGNSSYVMRQLSRTSLSVYKTKRGLQVPQLAQVAKNIEEQATKNIANQTSLVNSESFLFASIVDSIEQININVKTKLVTDFRKLDKQIKQLITKMRATLTQRNDLKKQQSSSELELSSAALEHSKKVQEKKIEMENYINQRRASIVKKRKLKVEILQKQLDDAKQRLAEQNDNTSIGHAQRIEKELKKIEDASNDLKKLETVLKQKQTELDETGLNMLHSYGAELPANVKPAMRDWCKSAMNTTYDVVYNSDTWRSFKINDDEVIDSSKVKKCSQACGDILSEELDEVFITMKDHNGELFSSVKLFKRFMRRKCRINIDKSLKDIINRARNSRLSQRYKSRGNYLKVLNELEAVKNDKLEIANNKSRLSNELSELQISKPIVFDANNEIREVTSQLTKANEEAKSEVFDHHFSTITLNRIKLQKKELKKLQNEIPANVNNATIVATVTRTQQIEDLESELNLGKSQLGALKNRKKLYKEMAATTIPAKIFVNVKNEHAALSEVIRKSAEDYSKLANSMMKFIQKYENPQPAQIVRFVKQYYRRLKREALKHIAAYQATARANQNLKNGLSAI